MIRRPVLVARESEEGENDHITQAGEARRGVQRWRRRRLTLLLLGCSVVLLLLRQVDWVIIQTRKKVVEKESLAFSGELGKQEESVEEDTGGLAKEKNRLVENNLTITSEQGDKTDDGVGLLENSYAQFAHDQHNGFVVEKTVYSNCSRLVVFTDVIFTKVDAVKRAVEVVCSQQKCISANGQGFDHLWNAFDPKVIVAEHDMFVKYLKRIASTSCERRYTYFLNLFQDQSSLVDFNTANVETRLKSEGALHERWVQNFGLVGATTGPDLYKVAKYSEACGVDLRIVSLVDPYRVPDSLRAESRALNDHLSLGPFRVFESEMETLYSLYSLFSRDFRIEVYKAHGQAQIDDFTGIRGLGKALLENFHPQHWSSKDASQMEATEDLRELGIRLYESIVDRTREIYFEGKPRLGLDTKDGHSKNSAIVFLAGLEGTGHHYWLGVFRNLRTLMPGRMIPVCTIGKHLFLPGKRWSSNPFSYGLWSTWDAQQYQIAFTNIESALASIAKVNQREGKRWYFVNFGKCHEDKPNNIWKGMLSYPNFGGWHKNLQRPHLPDLVHLANRTGANLRVIVILRDAESVIKSTVEHRNFYGRRPSMHQERCLENNAHALYAQVAALHPSVYTCVNYQDPSSVYSRKLAEFLDMDHDLLSHVLAISRRNKTRSIKVRNGKDDPPSAEQSWKDEEYLESREIFIQTFKAATHSLENLCLHS